MFRRDTGECGCGLSLLYSVTVRNCAVCGKLGCVRCIHRRKVSGVRCCVRCIHRRKVLPGHSLAVSTEGKNNKTDDMEPRSFPVCGVCHKDWNL